MSNLEALLNAKSNVIPIAGGLDNTPDPTDLPAGLAPVTEFNLVWLPSVIAVWLQDTQIRMGCPLAYLVATQLVMTSSLLGSKAKIQPTAYDTAYTISANLWGGIVGMPGTKKSPAMARILSYLKPFDKQNKADYEAALDAYQNAQKRLKTLNTELDKAKYGKGKMAELDAAAIQADIDKLEQVKKPLRKYHMINSATLQALQQALSGSPNGLLLFRDELMALYEQATSKDDGYQEFLMEAWTGSAGVGFNDVTIGRGDTSLEDACVSILGGIQPSRFMRFNEKMPLADNGFAERVQVLVWPDDRIASGVDQAPNDWARHCAWLALERCFKYEGVMGFSPEAQAVWVEWNQQNNARAEKESEGYRCLLSKEPDLVAKIALQLAILSDELEISRPTLENAIQIAAWLETHRRRAYGLSCTDDIKAAKALLAAIEAGKLSKSAAFTARDIQRGNWAGLGTARDVIDIAISVLCEYGHIRQLLMKPSTGGRPPAPSYELHPQYREA